MRSKIYYYNLLVVTWTVVINFLTFNGVQAASAPGESPPPIALQQRESSEKLLKLNYKVTSIPLQIVLDVATAIEKTDLGAAHQGQPLKIGFGRTMPQPYQGNIQPLLWWETLSNGDKVATFAVRSPEASSVRLGLYLNEFPETAELRFFNPNQLAQTFGPFHATAIRNRMPFWSPVVEGEIIGVEIYIPATVTTEFAIKIANIQHLIYSPLHPDSKNLAQIGNADTCEIDVKCSTTNPSNLSAAVAKIIFTRTDGSFICTGTLLSDTDNTTHFPYFMTAHHCISTQDAADTVNSYWFFEKAACNGTVPTDVTQFNSGSELLATGAETDFTLLKLRDNEISNLNGIYFAGWSSSANPIGLTIIGIHHPKGDLKKLSTGHADNYASWYTSGATNHIQVTWSQGVTEAGSGGSGLFAITGEQNNQHLFIGNLHGGWSFCNAPNEPDLYGRFDLTYPLVRQWLNASLTLNLSVIVLGNGTITSNPAGINCGSDCNENYANGTVVKITATAATGSVFARWSGACTGTATTCTVTMDAAKTVTATFNLAPKPDFTIPVMTIAPAIPVTNGTFTATVMVKNQGTVAADGSQLRLWANQATAPACAATGGNQNVAVGTIAAGSSKTFTITGLNAGVSGPKTLRAFVDAACVRVETNETNNQRTLSYRIAGRLPDLTITSITLTPATPAKNTVFNAAITVKNQGTLLGTGFLDVWTNQATTQTCGAVGDTWADVGALAAGASKIINVTGLNAGATAGAKTLRAFVDSWCEEVEGNEINNQLTKSYTVQ